MPSHALYKPETAFLIATELTSFLSIELIIIGNSGRIKKGAENPRVPIPSKKYTLDKVETI